MLSLLLAAPTFNWSSEPFSVQSSSWPDFRVGDVHTVTGNVLPKSGAKGSLTLTCTNGTMPHPQWSIDLKFNKSEGQSFTQTTYSGLANIGGTDHYATVIVMSVPGQSFTSSGFISVYSGSAPAAPGAPTQVNMFSNTLPQIPSCASSRTKQACEAVPDGCAWCVSHDSVHSLCFDDDNKPPASWACN